MTDTARRTGLLDALSKPDAEARDGMRVAASRFQDALAGRADCLSQMWMDRDAERGARFRMPHEDHVALYI